ncbi:MAG: family 43 glycosylhydrolase, partial [Oscillospiraceae bacterium]|nr:family 43 glycosylhydrolase [Oscillospiraceae bacterium]
MKRKTLIMTVSFVMGAVMLMSSIPMQFLFAGAASDTGTYAIRTRTAVPPVLTGPLNAATDVVLKTDPDTMINPVGISYQYQPEYQSRESADPAVALYKGVYYLFASHGSGYWWSDNLADWNYVYAMDSANLIPPHRSNNDFERFAPATMVIGDYLYITHSEGGSIFRSNNPKNPGSWEFIRAAVNGWGDPALFYDDELDRTFCYYGTSGSEPLYVVEMDHKTAGWPVLAGPIALYNSNREAHGYEVCGEDNEKFADNPFLEGAWMTKFGGKYYLEFGVPGTQWGSYADGVAVSDDPLGPFVHCDSSPVSIKPTGFVRGAGHGCTFEDKYGSWWKVDTVSLSTNTGFERRLILFPAGHNAYGDLVSNTVFSDYPMYKHEMTEFSLENPGPAWNL